MCRQYLLYFWRFRFCGLHIIFFIFYISNLTTCVLLTNKVCKTKNTSHPVFRFNFVLDSFHTTHGRLVRRCEPRSGYFLFSNSWLRFYQACQVNNECMLNNIKPHGIIQIKGRSNCTFLITILRLYYACQNNNARFRR